MERLFFPDRTSLFFRWNVSFFPVERLFFPDGTSLFFRWNVSFLPVERLFFTGGTSLFIDPTEFSQLTHKKVANYLPEQSLPKSIQSEVLITVFADYNELSTYQPFLPPQKLN